jgi:hypothetical protein
MFYTHILRKRHTKLYKHMREREIKTHTINSYPSGDFTHTHLYMFVIRGGKKESSIYLQIHRCVRFLKFARITPKKRTIN